MAERDYVTVEVGAGSAAQLSGLDLQAYIGQLEKRMRDAAADLEFEEAARLRDEIRRLEDGELGILSQRQAPAVAGGGSVEAAGWQSSRQAQGRPGQEPRPPPRRRLSPGGSPTATRGSARAPGRTCASSITASPGCAPCCAPTSWRWSPRPPWWAPRPASPSR